MALKFAVPCSFTTLLILFIAALFFTSISNNSFSVHAQTPTPSPKASPTPGDAPEIDPDDVISVTTSEVLLPVTVRDASGKLVEGLTREDFRIFEDGARQALSDIS